MWCDASSFLRTTPHNNRKLQVWNENVGTSDSVAPLRSFHHTFSHSHPPIIAPEISPAIQISHTRASQPAIQQPSQDSCYLSLALCATTLCDHSRLALFPLQDQLEKCHPPPTFLMMRKYAPGKLCRFFPYVFHAPLMVPAVLGFTFTVFFPCRSSNKFPTNATVTTRRFFSCLVFIWFFHLLAKSPLGANRSKLKQNSKGITARYKLRVFMAIVAQEQWIR